MMREEQFYAAIADPTAAPPHVRFGVYRNNVSAALINALGVRFPVTAALMGGKAFAELAGRHALANLPSSPVLIDYGGGFADRLSEPFASVAGLENLWWRAYHAAEAHAVTPDFLARRGAEELAALRFRFHPSFGLMAAPGNAGSVWRAVRDGRQAKFETAPQWLLVARPEADVAVTMLPQCSHDFITALAAGATLAEAYEACQNRHAGFDLASEIAALLSHRIIIGA